MYYAVRVEFSDGRTQWIAPANAQGVRRFDVFDEAASFQSEEQAKSAIAAMPADTAVRLSIVQIR
jgi:hypothetical protein